VTDEPEEALEPRTLADFLLDLSERDDVPEDVRDEATDWYYKETDDAPPADAEAEEGQEPG
jgi:hypothetical protein